MMDDIQQWQVIGELAELLELDEPDEEEVLKAVHKVFHSLLCYSHPRLDRHATQDPWQLFVILINLKSNNTVKDSRSIATSSSKIKHLMRLHVLKAVVMEDDEAEKAGDNDDVEDALLKCVLYFF